MPPVSRIWRPGQARTFCQRPASVCRTAGARGNHQPFASAGCSRSLAFGDRGKHEPPASAQRASAAPQVPSVCRTAGARGNHQPFASAGCSRSLAFGDRGKHEPSASAQRASAAPQVPGETINPLRAPGAPGLSHLETGASINLLRAPSERLPHRRSPGKPSTLCERRVLPVSRIWRPGQA